MTLSYQTTSLHGVRLICPTVHHDARGFFMESFNHQQMEETLGRSLHFYQDNHAHSKQHVLRGMHYQFQHPQAKLVRVLRGAILDVVVDLRQSSPSFKKWTAFTLTHDEPTNLWIPEGCAHGYITLSDVSDVLYKVTAPYQADDEYCLRWDDATINIDWQPNGVSPILSMKDERGKNFGDIPLFG